MPDVKKTKDSMSTLTTQPNGKNNDNCALSLRRKCNPTAIRPQPIHRVYIPNVYIYTFIYMFIVYNHDMHEIYELLCDATSSRVELHVRPPTLPTPSHPLPPVTIHFAHQPMGQPHRLALPCPQVRAYFFLYMYNEPH